MQRILVMDSSSLWGFLILRYPFLPLILLHPNQPNLIFILAESPSLLLDFNHDRNFRTERKRKKEKLFAMATSKTTDSIQIKFQGVDTVLVTQIVYLVDWN